MTASLAVLLCAAWSPHVRLPALRTIPRACTPHCVFDDVGNAAANMSSTMKNLFEGSVRTVTGDESYEFGDWTKKAVSDMTGKDASEYQFGDITKKAVADFTGKEVGTYKFGDLTTAALTKTEDALADARDAYFNDLPTALWNQAFGELTSAQRRDVVIAICQLAAAALMSLTLVNAILHSLQTFAAWVHVCKVSGLSPLYSAAQWGSFLNAHATLRLTLDVPTLPLRVLAAIIIVPSYRAALLKLQKRMPWRENRPILNRLAALGVAWLLINGMAVNGVTAIGVWVCARLVGVPAFG